MIPEQHVFSERYEMVKHIARGGMAQVYLARDLMLDRPVALKVLFPELSVDRSFVERFRREAKAAANLSHPNIVSVYDWGQGENTYYIVMEYVDGPTLSALLRQGPLPPDRAASIAASVAAALDFAHRRGVIHRDVKPGNVLIDDRGQVKVADFGIARAIGASEDLTQTGSVMGTATYFSPEQAQGYPVDPRSDVYSLGVVLYEMVAGRPPFKGDSPVSIAYKHVKEDAPPVSSVATAVPPALEAVIMKALAKDPEARYASAEEMRADLHRFLDGVPVLAAAAVGVGATRMMGTVSEPTVVQSEMRPPVDRPPTGRMTPIGPPPEERTRAALWLLALLVLILAALGLYFGGRQAGLFGSSTRSILVPSDLKNKPAQTAEAEMSHLGFTDVRTQNQPSAAIAANNVIDSNPTGGSTVRSNDPVVLLVSTGPAQVSVPDVTGQPYQQAGSALVAKGLQPQFQQTYSATVAQGAVIGTEPGPNALVGQNSVVKVSVSSGKQPVPIPNVAGDTPAQAGNKLGNLGLAVVQAQEPSTAQPAGVVTRTNPPAGTTVQAGSTVQVYISSGPPQSPVPNVVGQTRNQAQAAMAAAGLQANFQTVTVTDPAQNGLVQAESPGAGTNVDQGSTVILSIGVYRAPPTTTTTTSSTSTTSTTLAGLLGGGGGTG